MKILYIALKYDYGDKKRGHSFEHYNFYDSLVKMNGGKHEIVYFPFDEIMGEVGRDKMNEMLIVKVGDEKPDLCFFFLFTDEIKKETIKTITENSGSKTFNWFADDNWRFYTFSKHYAPNFHYVSTTDSEAINKYARIGYKNVIKTQWACNHFLYKPTSANKKYDATFVGQPHSDRKQVIESLRKNGVDIQAFGYGWDNGRISQDDMINLFSQSKINLNLSKLSVSSWSVVAKLKTIARIFIGKRGDGSITLNSPLLWIDNVRFLFQKKGEQIKGRNFEIPGCGGFLLTGYANDLEKYYTDGKEIVVFKDNDDLIAKTKYYLDNSDEREKIAKAGHQRTITEHTYEKRFNEIFNAIGL